MGITDKLTATAGLVNTMVRAGVIAPLRPDKYVRIAGAMARDLLAGVTDVNAPLDSVVELRLSTPQPELLDGVDPIFKLHMFFGLTVFLVFPFTRLVHVLTAPLNYVARSYQIVRAKRTS